MTSGCICRFQSKMDLATALLFALCGRLAVAPEDAQCAAGACGLPSGPGKAPRNPEGVAWAVADAQCRTACCEMCGPCAATAQA